MVTVKENTGKRNSLMAYGVDKIMDLSSSPYFTVVRKLFSYIPGEVFQKLPEKEVDLLIGCNHMDLHPSGGEGRNANGKLRVLNSKFGHGWVVAGYHPSFRIPARPYAAGVTAVTACRIEIHPQTNLDFMETDGLDVQSDSSIIRSRGSRRSLTL